MIIVVVFFLISLEKPDKSFWWAVIFYTDPGGYIQTYFSRSMIGGLQQTDLTFILLFLPLFSPKIKLKEAFENKDVLWLTKFLAFFMLIYHIIIYGFIAPGFSFTALLDHLQYERLTIWGWLVLIPAYIFFKRDHTYIIKLSLNISFIIMVLFYLTYLGIDLIPLWTAERYRGSDIMRRALLSYGFTNWFLFFSLIIFLLRMNVEKKKIMYAVGILFFFSVILTLTRRNYIYLVGVSTIIIFLLNRIKGANLSFAPYVKYVLLLITFLGMLSIFNPTILATVKQGIVDIKTMVTEGENTQGQEDWRLVHDIPIHLDRFKNSPYIGFGYNADWYSNQAELGGLSANDSPLTAALGMFGIIGCSLFFIFYLKIISIIRKRFYLLKIYYKSKWHTENLYPFLFSVFFISSLFYLYTIGFMNYFDDLIVGERRVIEMMLIGFMIASFELIKKQTSSDFKTINLVGEQNSAKVPYM